MNPLLGRLLCFSLGFLFMAGAVPLLNFGPIGKQIWAGVEAAITPLALAIGVGPWLVMWILGFFVFAGPLAVIWRIVGNQVNRTLWFVYGLQLMVCGGCWVTGRLGRLWRSGTVSSTTKLLRRKV